MISQVTDWLSKAHDANGSRSNQAKLIISTIDEDFAQRNCERELCEEGGERKTVFIEQGSSYLVEKKPDYRLTEDAIENAGACTNWRAWFFGHQRDNVRSFDRRNRWDLVCGLNYPALYTCRKHCVLNINFDHKFRILAISGTALS